MARSGRGKPGPPSGQQRRPMFVERVREMSAAQQIAPPVKPPTASAEGYIRLTRPLNLAPPSVPLAEGMAITPLVANDAAAVHALLHSAYAGGFGTVPDRALDWWNSTVNDAEFDRTLTWVAKDRGDVVGYCLCWSSSFLKDLVVAPLWRNRGIGSALLSTAIAALRARGGEEVTLKVKIYNGAAQRLYRQFGFSQD
jgi:ribosomal protein S18 acetylase RimI-like enzyme